MSFLNLYLLYLNHLQIRTVEKVSESKSLVGSLITKISFSEVLSLSIEMTRKLLFTQMVILKD